MITKQFRDFGRNALVNSLQGEDKALAQYQADISGGKKDIREIIQNIRDGFESNANLTYDGLPAANDREAQMIAQAYFFAPTSDTVEENLYNSAGATKWLTNGDFDKAIAKTDYGRVLGEGITSQVDVTSNAFSAMNPTYKAALESTLGAQRTLLEKNHEDTFANNPGLSKMQSCGAQILNENQMVTNYAGKTRQFINENEIDLKSYEAAARAVL